MTFKYTYYTIWLRSLYDLCSIFQTYYRLKIGAFHGTIQDKLIYHKDQPFSTKDRGNSNGGSCASDYKGGWWYNFCHYSNLNGINYGYKKSNSKSMSWLSFGNGYESLKSIKMAIRPQWKKFMRGKIHWRVPKIVTIKLHNKNRIKL